MLIDAIHPEETQVVVDTINSGIRLRVAIQSAARGNIYLAKITRVEPSQAALWQSTRLPRL